MNEINDMSNINTNLLRNKLGSGDKIEFNNRKKIRQGNISIFLLNNNLIIYLLIKIL
jgi:hypothetical protein